MKYIFGGVVYFILNFLIGLPTQAVETGAIAENLGLYGGEVRDIAVSSDTGVIALSTYSPNGFFLSADGGTSWTGMAEGSDYGEPQGVEAGDADELYFLSSDGLFVSADAGQTITEIGDFEAFGEEFLVRGDLIVIGRSDGSVSISSDGGDTFDTTVVAEGATMSSLSVASDDTLFALANFGSTSELYTSVDQGATWTEVNTETVGVTIGLVAAHPTLEDVVFVTSMQADEAAYISEDGGTTWSVLTVEPFVTQITFDSTGRVYFGVEYSDDTGATWASVNATTPASRVSGIILPDPVDPTVLYGASFGAFAKSVDQGENWVDTNAGITAVTVKDIAQSIDKQVIWTATNAGLAKTENFLSDAPTWEFPLHYDFYPESVWVSPVDANHVVVGGYEAVHVSTDGGENWTTATGWNSDYTAGQLVSDATGAVLYAPAYYNNYTDFKTGDVYRSLDGGFTWESLAFEEGATQSAVLHPNGDLYVGTGSITLDGDGPTGIYVYREGAWEYLEDSPDMEITSLAIDPNDSDRLYATAADFDTYGAESDTTSGLYISADSGVTWDRVTTGLSNATRLRALSVQIAGDEAHLYLAGSDKLSNHGMIYKSIDNGQTWGAYFEGLRNEVFYALLFDGLLAGNSRGAYGLQSRAQLSVQKIPVVIEGVDKMRIVATLTDSATQQPLAGYRIRFLKKLRSGEWRFIRVKQTGQLGKTSFVVRPNRRTYFRVSFRPRGIAAEEFQRVRRVIRVRDLQ